MTNQSRWHSLYMEGLKTSSTLQLTKSHRPKMIAQGQGVNATNINNNRISVIAQKPALTVEVYNDRVSICDRTHDQTIVLSMHIDELKRCLAQARKMQKVQAILNVKQNTDMTKKAIKDLEALLDKKK